METTENEMYYFTIENCFDGYSRTFATTTPNAMDIFDRLKTLFPDGGWSLTCIGLAVKA